MSWNPDGTAYPHEFFGSLDPSEVLYDFDGPRIFTTLGPLGETFLAYQCGEEIHSSRYIVVPANAELIDALRAGRTTMREALHQPWTWFVERSHTGEILRAEKVELHKLPKNALPRPGVFLLPSLRPLLSIRMVGEELRPGSIPASVIRRAVEGASSAVKVLAEQVLQVAPTSGRPEHRLRRYYDLPAQRLAFGSFEVAFATPPVEVQTSSRDAEDKALDEIGKLLQRGLDWATSEHEKALPSSEESRVILDALAELTPPRHGVVTEVHLGGRLAGSGMQQRVLTRVSSERVRRVRKAMTADVRPVKYAGVVREFDKDNLTFTLRDLNGRNLCKCSFAERLYDDALAAFDGDEPITVLGHESATRKEVDVLSIVPGTQA